MSGPRDSIHSDLGFDAVDPDQGNLDLVWHARNMPLMPDGFVTGCRDPDKSTPRDLGLIGVMSFEPTYVIQLGFDTCGVVIATLGADIKPLLRKCCWLRRLSTVVLAQPRQLGATPMVWGSQHLGWSWCGSKLRQRINEQAFR